MIDELRALLHVTLPSAGGPRAVSLDLPSVLWVSGMIDDDTATQTAERLAIRLGTFVLTFVRSVDGRRLEYPDEHGLSADATFMRALLSHVRTLIDTYRERGKIFARCPGCRAWEAEMTFTAYALTIACPLPSSFDGPWFTPFWLSSRTLIGHRRDTTLPRCARITFELPSASLGIAAPFTGGELDEVLHQPEDYQEDPDDDDDDDESDEDQDEPTLKLRRTGPGWRALLRLSRAITPPVTVDQLAELSCLDLFFLELVHFLVWKAPVNADTPGGISCPRCHTTFVPIR